MQVYWLGELNPQDHDIGCTGEMLSVQYHPGRFR